MNQGPDSSSTGSQPSPYERLGIETGASFEAVQAAKQARLEEVGENPQARAQVEAAYDAVLMDRLKERQQGKVSTAALNASAREAKAPSAAPSARPSLPFRPKLPALPKASVPSSLPRLELAEGPQRWLPLGCFAALTLLLLFTPASSAELVLALSTLFSVVLLQRRNQRFLQAVGFSVLLLSLGLGLGALLLQVLDPSLPLGFPLDAHQVQSLPALLLLFLGALLIA
ncbi:MAG: CPP1-like family protein [Synechococcus sp. WH 8007]|nr:CPP1-like family protein [Synechococcus sp. WH 8007]